MGTTISLFFRLALLAPVFFAPYAAQAETLSELRREMAITAVEDAVTLGTKGVVTLFIARENQSDTYLRWSRDPRMLFSSKGWILEFTGFVVRTRPGIREAVRGYAEVEVSQGSVGENICHSVSPVRIYFKSFVGPFSLRPNHEQARAEHCVRKGSNGLRASNSQSRWR